MSLPTLGLSTGLPSPSAAISYERPSAVWQGGIPESASVAVSEHSGQPTTGLYGGRDGSLNQPAQGVLCSPQHSDGGGGGRREPRRRNAPDMDLHALSAQRCASPLPRATGSQVLATSSQAFSVNDGSLIAAPGVGECSVGVHCTERLPPHSPVSQLYGSQPMDDPMCFRDASPAYRQERQTALPSPCAYSSGQSLHPIAARQCDTPAPVSRAASGASHRFPSSNAIRNGPGMGAGAMCVAYLSPTHSPSPCRVRYSSSRSPNARRYIAKRPTRRSEETKSGWLLPRSPRMQSPPNRRYELAVVAALLTPRAVPMPRLIPSPSNAATSAQARTRVIDPPRPCAPPSPMAKLNPFFGCRGFSCDANPREKGAEETLSVHPPVWKEARAEVSQAPPGVPSVTTCQAPTAHAAGPGVVAEGSQREASSHFAHGMGSTNIAANGAASPTQLRAASGAANLELPGSSFPEAAGAVHFIGFASTPLISQEQQVGRYNQQVAAHAMSPAVPSLADKASRKLAFRYGAASALPERMTPLPSTMSDRTYVGTVSSSSAACSAIDNTALRPLKGEDATDAAPGGCFARVSESMGILPSCMDPTLFRERCASSSPPPQAWTAPPIPQAFTTLEPLARRAEPASASPLRGVEAVSVNKDARSQFSEISAGLQKASASVALESLMNANPLSTLSFPFQFMGGGGASGVAAEGVDVEESRVRALLKGLEQLKSHPTCLKPRDVIFESSFSNSTSGELKYQVIEEGSFGKVFAGSMARRPDQKVAIKVPVEAMLKTDPSGVMERFTNEWKILAACDHPGIIRLVGGVVHGPFDVWLVTELVKNGYDLHSRKYSRDPAIKRSISPGAAISMCRQLASVVAYLHEPLPARGKPIIVHRDIKPENVIVDEDWRIQLCDFGDAEGSTDGRVSRVSGATWFYAPPELLMSSPIERAAGLVGPNSASAYGPSSGADRFDATRQGAEVVFSEKWDVWSMGCVFHEMFGFQNPFHTYVAPTDQPDTIYAKLKTCAQQNTLHPVIDPRLQGRVREIITRCLHPNPAERPSAEEVFRMWICADELLLKDIQIDAVLAQPATASEKPQPALQHYAPSSTQAHAEPSAALWGANAVSPAGQQDPVYLVSASLHPENSVLGMGGRGGVPGDRSLREEVHAKRKGAQLVQDARMQNGAESLVRVGSGVVGAGGEHPNGDGAPPSYPNRLSPSVCKTLRTDRRSAHHSLPKNGWQYQVASPLVLSGKSGAFGDAGQQSGGQTETEEPYAPAPTGWKRGNRAMQARRDSAGLSAANQGIAGPLGTNTSDEGPGSRLFTNSSGRTTVRHIVGEDGFVSVPNLAIVSPTSADFIS
ncbi:protein kinase [Besnoitia besnoiti]|uniref:Protein kinase n=1 Tax=Besnoitia besnoiti TaxID=94643 RepID=A0A2A9MJG1_BESBE|nr:protein kinase [Besnoitia besnoiti]PFH38678.1 protein kinase [Besnoitia besnoiti]